MAIASGRAIDVRQFVDKRRRGGPVAHPERIFGDRYFLATNRHGGAEIASVVLGIEADPDVWILPDFGKRATAGQSRLTIRRL